MFKIKTFALVSQTTFQEKMISAFLSSWFGSLIFIFPFFGLRFTVWEFKESKIDLILMCFLLGFCGGWSAIMNLGANIKKYGYVSFLDWLIISSVSGLCVIIALFILLFFEPNLIETIFNLHGAIIWLSCCFLGGLIGMFFISIFYPPNYSKFNIL